MTALKDYTLEQLEAEIEGRKNARPLANNLQDINWTNVVGYCINAVKMVDEDGCCPKEFDNTMMELVMEAVYGHDIWQWWNRKCNA